MSVWEGYSGSMFEDEVPLTLGADAFCVSTISASMSTSISGSLGASSVVGCAGEGEDMVTGTEGRDHGDTDLVAQWHQQAMSRLALCSICRF